jgi:hypothetical protein
VSGGGRVLGSCHCGRVTIQLPDRPGSVTECNCSLCTKLGSRCVYFAADELRIEGQFDDYVRSDIAEPMIRIRRCATCGCWTHWEPLTEPPHERIGVNARLLEPSALEGADVRHVDGASWE